MDNQTNEHSPQVHPLVRITHAVFAEYDGLVTDDVKADVIDSRIADTDRADWYRSVKSHQDRWFVEQMARIDRAAPAPQEAVAHDYVGAFVGAVEAALQSVHDWLEAAADTLETAPLAARPLLEVNPPLVARRGWDHDGTLEWAQETRLLAEQGRVLVRAVAEMSAVLLQHVPDLDESRDQLQSYAATAGYLAAEDEGATNRFLREVAEDETEQPAERDDRTVDRPGTRQSGHDEPR